jgi:hypothetical protein
MHLDIGNIFYLCDTHRQKERKKRQMEILNKLRESQNTLEDALRLEVTPEEVKETQEGRRLLRYLRWRRRITNHLAKGLSKIF